MKDILSKNLLVFVLYLCFTNNASALSVEEISFQWNHVSSGENVTIKSNNDVFDSRLGQGRISSTTEFAANFVVSYQGGERCWYYVTTTNNRNKINLAVRNVNQSQTTCLRGTFERADDGASPRSPTVRDQYKFITPKISWSDRPGSGLAYIDTCLFSENNRGTVCGKPAADTFCKRKGYTRASSWDEDWAGRETTYRQGAREAYFGSGDGSVRKYLINVICTTE